MKKVYAIYVEIVDVYTGEYNGNRTFKYIYTEENNLSEEIAMITEAIMHYPYWRMRYCENKYTHQPRVWYEEIEVEGL